MIARQISQQLTTDLGQPFVVDNRAGGGEGCINVLHLMSMEFGGITLPARVQAVCATATGRLAFLTFTSPFFFACQRSYWPCIRSQISGPLPTHLPTRSAISAVMAERPLITRDRVTRDTPSCSAASVTLSCSSGNTSSRMIRPGCEGLCIVIFISFQLAITLVVVLIINQLGVLAFE